MWLDTVADIVANTIAGTVAYHYSNGQITI